VVVEPATEMRRNRLPVRRCLFGRPSQDEVDRFLEEGEEILRRQEDKASRRWGFDFRAGQPMTDVDEKSRRYEWTLVNSSDCVPSVYNRLVQSTKLEANAATDTATTYGVSEANTSRSCASVGTATTLSAVADLEKNPSTSHDNHDSSTRN